MILHYSGSVLSFDSFHRFAGKSFRSVHHGIQSENGNAVIQILLLVIYNRNSRSFGNINCPYIVQSFMDKLQKNKDFFSSTLFGNVHEVVIDKVVVEILCGNTLKHTQDQIFQERVITVDCLNIEYSVPMSVVLNLNVIQIHIQ